MGSAASRFRALVGRAGSSGSKGLPFPPLEMRALVGPTDVAAYDNPTGKLVYDYLEPERYRRVFDFGCGCGRVARQLILQNPRPERYVGIDVHRGMIEWATRNLSPCAENFEFRHHDVYSGFFNPRDGLPETAPFPVEDRSFTLVNALSVFTHLTERQTPFYLRETSRIVAEDGVVSASFFLIDKKDFPMMMESNNALYISYEQPTSAVLHDRNWIRKLATECGLTIARVIPPAVRNYQWQLVMTPSRPGLSHAEFPEDAAPVGEVVTPPMPSSAPHLIGLDDR